MIRFWLDLIRAVDKSLSLFVLVPSRRRILLVE